MFGRATNTLGIGPHSSFTVSKLTMFYVDKLALVQTFTVSHGQHKLLYLPTGVAQQREVDVFSGVCLFLCQSVSQHENFRTIKSGMMKLGS